MSTSDRHTAKTRKSPNKRRVRQKVRRRKSEPEASDWLESEESHAVIKDIELAIQELLSKTMPGRTKTGYTISSQTHDWRGRFELMLAKLAFVTSLFRDSKRRQCLESCWFDQNREESEILNDELDDAIKIAFSEEARRRSAGNMSPSDYVRRCDESLGVLAEALSLDSGHSWFSRISGFLGWGEGGKDMDTASISNWWDSHQARLDRIHHVKERVAELKTLCSEQGLIERENRYYLHPLYVNDDDYLDVLDDDGYSVRDAYEDPAYELEGERYPEYYDDPPPRRYRYQQDSGSYYEPSWGETLDSLVESMRQTAQKTFEVGVGCGIMVGGAYTAAKITGWLFRRSGRHSIGDTA